MPAGVHCDRGNPIAWSRAPEKSGDGVRVPRTQRSSRALSPTLVATAFEQNKSRRMPEGLHRSRVRIPPGPTLRARSSVGRAISSFQHLVAANDWYAEAAGMPTRTTSCHDEAVFADPRPAARQSRRMPMGVHWVKASACGSNPQSSHRSSSPVLTRANAGRTPWESAWRVPGGRRFDSASGQPDSSEQASGHSSSPDKPAAANAGGTTRTSVSPVRFRPGVSP